jgi:tRNA threonylcarbamoyladenosine biosynthesis protein TsaB
MTASTEPLTLSIDTSTSVTSAALVRGGDVLDRFSHDDRMAHAEVLSPGIDRLLAQHGIAGDRLERVVVGVGPGPFTGLRVGVVSAIVLARAVSAELVGVCSLDALSLQVGADAFSDGGWLLAGTDARRREVYVAGYDGPGRRTLGPDVLLPAEARRRAEQEVASQPGRRLVFAGAGPAGYPETFGTGIAALTPDAGLLAVGVNTDLLSPMPVHPLYLRLPDAVASAGAKPVLASAPRRPEGRA